MFIQFAVVDCSRGLQLFFAVRTHRYVVPHVTVGDLVGVYVDACVMTATVTPSCASSLEKEVANALESSAFPFGLGRTLTLHDKRYE